MTISFQLDNTSFRILVLLLGIILFMIWIKVLMTRLACARSSKVEKRIDKDGTCPSFVSEASFGTFAIALTAGAVALTAWAYQQLDVDEDRNPCELGLDTEGCDVAEYCWNPPVLEEYACKTYCDRLKPQFSEECLVQHCEAALVGNVTPWEDPEDELVSNCYDVCLQRLEQPGNSEDTTCYKLICSQPEDEIAEDLKDTVNAYCNQYCADHRAFYTECYVRTCGTSTEEKCSCFKFLECQDEECDPDLVEEYDAACAVYCEDNPVDSLCSSYDCVKDPLFGCNITCNENCLPNDGKAFGLRNISTKQWVSGYSSTRMVGDYVDDYAVTVVESGYIIYDPNKPYSQLVINPRNSEAQFQEERATIIGETFVFVSTGMAFEYYIQTRRTFNSGAGVYNHRYLGIVDKRIESNETCSCVPVLGLVSTPSSANINSIKWRFGPVA